MMTIRTGDLEPDLVVVLSADEPVDTTGATLRVIGSLSGVDELVIDRAPTAVAVVGTTTEVTLAWAPGDTDVPGFLNIDVEVSWPTDRVQTFSSDGVTIEPALDYEPA